MKKETGKLIEAPPSPKSGNEGELDEETLLLNRQRLALRMKEKDKKKDKSPRASKEGKKPRVWDLGGTNKDLENLDRTRDKPADDEHPSSFVPDRKVLINRNIVDKFTSKIRYN